MNQILITVYHLKNMREDHYCWFLIEHTADVFKLLDIVVDELILLNWLNGSSGFQSDSKIFSCLHSPQVWASNVEFEIAGKIGVDVLVISFNFRGSSLQKCWDIEVLIPVFTVLHNSKILQILQCINKRDLLALNNNFEHSKHLANCSHKN